MVTLYVDGKPVGSWADAEKLFAETAATRAIEFRDDTGRVIATSVPGADEPPAWEREITPEETARRMAEPGLPLEEAKKWLGWK
jgi:hypothetical protein